MSELVINEAYTIHFRPSREVPNPACCNVQGHLCQDCMAMARHAQNHTARPERDADGNFELTDNLRAGLASLNRQVGRVEQSDHDRHDLLPLPEPAVPLTNSRYLNPSHGDLLIPPTLTDMLAEERRQRGEVNEEQLTTNDLSNGLPLPNTLEVIVNEQRARAQRRGKVKTPSVTANTRSDILPILRIDWKTGEIV